MKTLLKDVKIDYRGRMLFVPIIAKLHINENDTECLEIIYSGGVYDEFGYDAEEKYIRWSLIYNVNWIQEVLSLVRETIKFEKLI